MALTPPPDNEIYPWLTPVWAQLARYLVQQRPPQAVLLSGPPGLGKRRLADTFAAALLCHQPTPAGFACGRCSACLLAQAGNHPDWLQLAPEESGKAIGVDSVRQFLASAALKPLHPAFRPVLIDPADSLNRNSANSLLKYLEEPGERTCFILVAEQPDKLPPTVRSRCQLLRCPSATLASAGGWLAQQGVTENQGLLLAMAHNAPLKAKEFAEQNLCAQRGQMFQEWLALAGQRADPLAVAESWLKQPTPEPEERLAWIAGWLGDIVKLALGGGALGNPDLSKELQSLSKRLDLKRLYHYYDSVLLNRRRLSAPLNRQLLIEGLLIDWSRLNG